jgi:hypothetical protein
MSAQSMRTYFVRDFGISPGNILDLFDVEADPLTIVSSISDFLAERCGRGHLKPELRAVVLYYVGHGGFAGVPETFVLFLRESRSDRRFSTTLNSQLLAEALGGPAEALHRILVLDCCFSGAMYTIPLQSDPQQIVERRVTNLLTENPLGGAAVLAAASAQDVTFFPTELRRTLFTEALVRVLSAGAADAGDFLALDEVCQLTISEVREISYGIAELKGLRLPRPELHVLGQRSINVGKLPFFPNAASPRFAELQSRKDLQKWASEVAAELPSLRAREATLQQTVRTTTLTWLTAVREQRINIVRRLVELPSLRSRGALLKRTVSAAAANWFAVAREQQVTLLRGLIEQSNGWAKGVRAVQGHALDLASRIECEESHHRELDHQLLKRWLSIQAQKARDQLAASEIKMGEIDPEWTFFPGVFGQTLLLLLVIVSPVVMLARREFSFGWLSSANQMWLTEQARRDSLKRGKRAVAKAEFKVEAFRTLELEPMMRRFGEQRENRSRVSFGRILEDKVSRFVLIAYFRWRIFVWLRRIAWIIVIFIGLILFGLILQITGQIPPPH